MLDLPCQNEVLKNIEGRGVLAFDVGPTQGQPFDVGPSGIFRVDLKTSQGCVDREGSLELRKEFLVAMEMLVDVHENVRVGVAKRSEVERGFGTRYVLQLRLQRGGPLRFKGWEIRLSHIQLNESPATPSLLEKRRPDLGGGLVSPVDEDRLSENGPPCNTLESWLSPRGGRNQEGHAVGEIDFDRDFGVIRPPGPEFFAIAVEDPIYLFQAEKLGLDIGFQRGQRGIGRGALVTAA